MSVLEYHSKKQASVRVVHTRVFAAGPGGGNPCPVIPDADWLSDDEMQRLAAKFGLDTAYLLRPQGKGCRPRLRYFVPHHEMGVSGHATIAAVTVALLDQTVQSSRLRIETSNGLFNVEWARHGDEYLVVLGQNKPVFGSTVDPELVARVLKIRPERINLTKGPIQVVSVSRAKLLVPLDEWQVLNSLTPDFDAVWKLCDTYGASGVYPFTRNTDKKNAYAEARQFPVRAGFPEDAATGVAAAALGAYLTRFDLSCRPGTHEFRIAQGYAMGAPSLIEAIVACADRQITRTAIRGMAHITSHERVAVCT
jgi:trans-2,3-dihydro-3-hydroxyanthranilate isomerase